MYYDVVSELAKGWDECLWPYPGTLSETVKAKLVRNLSRIHRILPETISFLTTDLS